MLVWHQGHTAVDCLPCLAMFFPCAKWPVMCLVTHLCLPGLLSLIALSIACRSSSLCGCVVSGSLVSQYCCAAGLFIANCSAHWWCLMILSQLMSNRHDLNGRGRFGSSGLSLLMLPLAAKSASMFIHTSRESTMGYPLSWCPFTCWNMI